MDRNVRLMCFTELKHEDPAEIPMWGYYAAKHQGVRIHVRRQFFEQAGFSLAFHIIFAEVGIGLFFLMVIAEGMYLRTHRPIYLELAKRWARESAIPFAVGLVQR